MGKRDASYDIDLPMPRKHYRRGVDSLPQAAPADWTVSAMNDQHAYLRYTGVAHAPEVGDLVGCGISHPCSTFDRWRALFTVDDDYRVTGAVRTFF
jgi:D-serine dehydratase